MTSVVIAAYNEAAVIGRCLDALLAGAAPGEFDVTVVANGCTDDTAGVARERPGVRVVERAEPGKPGALNAGDAVAAGFPRVYLDADIVLGTAGLRAVAGALGGPCLAATVRRELDVRGRPAAVRAYFAVHNRLPAMRDALYGRGVIALSRAGRERFGEFPDLVADDLFLDSLFSAGEKRVVAGFAARVATPRRTGELLDRLARVRRGNAGLRAAAAGGAVRAEVRSSARWSWLRDVVVPRPWLAPAAAVYVGLTLVADRRGRTAGDAGWARDESSRQAQAPAGGKG